MNGLTATLDALRQDRAQRQQVLLPEVRQFSIMDSVDRANYWHNRDANNTLFIERFLQAYSPTIYEVLRPEKSYSKLMPVNSSKVAPGATEYIYTVSDTTGTTKTLQGSADTTDLPNAGATLTEQSKPTQYEGNYFAYTLQELDRAAMQAANGLQVDLVNMRRKAAFRAHEQTWNDVALLGNSFKGTFGLFNDTDIPASAVANNGTGSSTLWANKTAQQIFDDIAGAIGVAVSNTLGVFRPNTLALPTEQYEVIRGRNMGPEGTRTIYELLTQTYRDLTILDAPELNGAFSGSADGFIVYRNDPDVLEFLVAKPYTETPAQLDLLSYKIAAVSEFVAGPVIYQPKAILIKTGI